MSKIAVGIGYSVHWGKVSRASSGGRAKSVIAKLAYDHRLELHDPRTGITHDYRHFSPCGASVVYLPENAPVSWSNDIERIGRAMESSENRSNSQTAWTLMCALPLGLDRGQQIELMSNIIMKVGVNRMLAGIGALHDEVGNPHCHCVFSTRTVTPDGFGKKDRSLMRPGFIKEVRKIVAEEAAKTLLKAADTSIDPVQKKT